MDKSEKFKCIKDKHDYCHECGHCFTCSGELKKELMENVLRVVDEWWSEAKGGLIAVELLKSKLKKTEVSK